MSELHNAARGNNEWAEVYSDLGAQPQEQRIPVPISSLDFWQYPDGRPQPFTPYSEEDLWELAKDIEQNGMAHSILVRPMSNGRFQTVAGEHRIKAHQLLGRTVIDATVRKMDDETAEACMLSSNLQTRRGNKPSDTARIYKALLEVQQQRIRRSQRTDLTVTKLPSQLGANEAPDGNCAETFGAVRREHSLMATAPKLSAQSKLRSDDEAAKTIGISGDTLRNYIRLLNLLQPILDMVDVGHISVSAGFELAYLATADQQHLLDLLPEGRSISVSQAKRLRKAAPFQGDLQVLQILGIVKEKKKLQLSLKPKLNIPQEDLKRLVSDIDFLIRAEKLVETLAQEYLKQMKEK